MSTSNPGAPESTGRFMSSFPVSSGPSRKLEFTDLPIETQEQIIEYVDQKDLFILQRLNPHFFSLVSAKIYRDLNLKITNTGDEESGIQGTHAADTLETILASGFDYGKYIKRIRLGMAEDFDNTPSQPTRYSQDPLLMTRLLWDSKSDSSKFLNTALLLVARKTTMLETFHWDAPIELSRAVYQALHQIPSLRHLRVRLDASQTPKMVIRQGPPPHAHPPPSTQGIPPLPQFTPAPPNIPQGALSNVYTGTTATKTNNVKRKKVGGAGGCNYWANGRAFSGFKTLSTLAIMRLSNLDCLPEIAGCIKASSATLKSLTLSLSTDLAQKSRKPVAVNPDLEDPSDTELEDDEPLNEPIPPPTNTQAAPQTNEADIRKERLAQESILAKIFDLHSVSSEGRRLEKKLVLREGINEERQQKLQSSLKKAYTSMKTLADSPIISSDGKYDLEHFKMLRDIFDTFISTQSVLLEQKNLLKPETSSLEASESSTKLLNPTEPSFKLIGQGSKPKDWSKMALSSPTFAEIEAKSSPLLNGSAQNHAPGGNLFGNSASNSPSPSKPNHFPLPDVSMEHSSDENLKKLAQQQAMKQTAQQGTNSPVYTSPYTGKTLSAPESAWNNSPSLTDPPVAQCTYTASGEITSSWFHPNPFPKVGNPTETKATPQMPLSSSEIASAVDSDNDIDANAKASTPGVFPLGHKFSFFPAHQATEIPEDSMDVDMDHPDEDTVDDLGEDQEIVVGSDDPEPATPRKRAKLKEAELGGPSDAAASGSLPSGGTQVIAENVPFEDTMQAYIRATHGLHLETLSLEWVPIKASIVARALDLSVLRNLILLEVGSQDALWTLLERLQSHSPTIQLKTIHTDHVSLPFLKFLQTFTGLEELFMHERASKPEADAGSVPTVSITTIRKKAIETHVDTLKRLMIRNERNEQWDVDTKTLHFLSFRGKGLNELAISLNMKTYHVLLQLLASFRNLHALHLIALRSTDRNAALQSESLNFAIDNLSHCRETKIKYIALVNSVTVIELKPDQLKRQLRFMLERRKDKKGKAKAWPEHINALLEQYELESNSEGMDDILASVMATEIKARSPTNFTAAKDVKIFSRQIRNGRL